MTGPALQELGLALITAHMIIFWLAQSSNVTPPIALAAFAGAGVAGAAPMQSAVEAVKLASGLFIIPLMMAFSPLLLSAENGWSGVLMSALVTGLLMLMLSMVLQNSCLRRFLSCTGRWLWWLLDVWSTHPRRVGW